MGRGAVTAAARLRSVAGGTIGNLVEWFDFYVYSAFSLYFAHVFFPAGDATAQLLNTAAVFAIGFVMRPVGGWLLGVYADRRGRKAALTLSVLLMCGGSAIIALTPGYDRIGVAAPVLLVVARLLQGLSVGGEYGASATYLSEMAGRTNRGFLASFQYVTLIGGQLLALGVLLVLQATLSEADLHAWGWRIPFVVGAGAGAGRAAAAGVARRDRGVRARRRGRSAAAVGAARRALAAGRAGRHARGRRQPRFLYLHHVHAEIPGQHARLDQARRQPDRGGDADRVHGCPAVVRRTVRPCRAAAAADRLRCPGGVRHCPAADRAQPHRRSTASRSS